MAVEYYLIQLLHKLFSHFLIVGHLDYFQFVEVISTSNEHSSIHDFFPEDM